MQSLSIPVIIRTYLSCPIPAINSQSSCNLHIPTQPDPVVFSFALHRIMIASSENRNQAVRWLHAFTIIGMVLGTLATADLQHPPLRYGASKWNVQSSNRTLMRRHARRAASTMAERCLLCLCTTMSGCSRTEYCSGNLCGMFRLTSAYWVDANRPTLGNQDPDSPMAFQRCALSSSCSAITVRRYMAAFERVICVE